MSSKTRNRAPVGPRDAAKKLSPGTGSVCSKASFKTQSTAQLRERLSVYDGRIFRGYIERIRGGWQIIAVRGERSRVVYPTHLEASRAFSKGDAS